MDPTTTEIVVASLSGPATAFVQGVSNVITTALGKHMEGQQAKAVQQANDNVMGMLKGLSERLSALEQSRLLDEEKLRTVLDDPDFTVLLRKSMVSAAQTDRQDKHTMLARLVSERLLYGTDTTFAQVSKRAADVVGEITSRQIRLLGFATVVGHIRTPLAVVGSDISVAHRTLAAKLMSLISPYLSLRYSDIDVKHLISTGCLAYNSFSTTDLNQMDFAVDYPQYRFTFSMFRELYPDIANPILSLWNNGIGRCTLSSVGLIIGTYASDLISGTPTIVSGWD